MTNLKEQIAEANNKLEEAKSNYYKLVQKCAHEVVIKSGYNGAKCDTCSKDMGWWCPDSPKHYCEYAEDDRWNDECIYCGEPEERK